MKTQERGFSLVSAAVMGLFAGLATVTAVSLSQAASSGARDSGISQKPAAKHCCAGKNACKGQGGCGADKGKNSCAGKGGCSTKTSCKGKPCTEGDGGT
jgi:hypothetical protein